jgi:hypothetical protein
MSERDSSWDENNALDSYLEIYYSDENAEPSSTFFFLFRIIFAIVLRRR